MAALRERGCKDFGVLGTSYGGWIGALLAMVERDFRFVALMCPIVNVEHPILQKPGTAFIPPGLRRAKIPPELAPRHFHLTLPSPHQPFFDPTPAPFLS